MGARMKHIYLNLKRFDVVPERGGVNRLAAPLDWGAAVVSAIQEGIEPYTGAASFAAFLPESQLASALGARRPDSPLAIGPQGVHREDVAPGGNFGAMTSLRPASAMAQIGCGAAIIGHCEERGNLRAVLDAAGVAPDRARETVDALLGAEVRAAQAAGLSVLLCIGEHAEEQGAWEEVLGHQLDAGLDGADASRVVIAYEPVWSIGPGKTPADAPYIQKIARFVKERTGGADVVYGGGLKADNAKMLAGIAEIDGGLIALTRFAGEIGFYPDEYLEIVDRYLNA